MSIARTLRFAALAAVAALTVCAVTARAADLPPADPSPVASPVADTTAADPKTPIATVNGAVITRHDFERNWKYFMSRSGIPESHEDKSGQVDEFRVQVLDRLIDEELLYQAAQAEKLVAGDAAVQAELDKARGQFPTPEAFAEALAKNGLDEAGLRALFTRNLSIQGYVEGHLAKGISVTDAEVHDFYAANTATFAIPEEVRARHILVAATDEDNATVRAEKRAKAEALLAQLRGGADFAELAKKSSECPSAPEGGDLGFFGRGDMAPQFEEAAFALKPGELSAVVETQFGFHVIRVEERREAGMVPEAEVAPRIREFLTAQKTETAVEERLGQLRAAAKIEKRL